MGKRSRQEATLSGGENSHNSGHYSDFHMKKNLGDKKYDTNTASRGRKTGYKNKDAKKPRNSSPGWSTYNPNSSRVSKFDVSDLSNLNNTRDTILSDQKVELDKLNRVLDIKVSLDGDKDVTNRCTVKAKKSHAKVKNTSNNQAQGNYMDNLEAEIDAHFFGCTSFYHSDGNASDTSSKSKRSTASTASTAPSLEDYLVNKKIADVEEDGEYVIVNSTVEVDNDTNVQKVATSSHGLVHNAELVEDEFTLL